MVNSFLQVDKLPSRYNNNNDNENSSSSVPPVKVAYQQPVEFAHFSYNKNRQISFDDSGLKVFKYPSRLPSDLNEGFPSKYITKTENVKRNPELINPILQILHDRFFHDKELEWPNSIAPSVVTWRGIITKLMVLPYSASTSPSGSYFRPTKLLVVKKRGTLFLTELMDDEAWKRQEMGTEREKRMCYWGRRFEHVCTRPKAKIASDEDDPEEDDDIVNENEEYGILARTKLGTQYRMLIGAEVDCLEKDEISPSSPPSISRYVELKTAKRHSTLYFMKAVQMWAQSFLIGIEQLIIGLRNEHGTLRQISHQQVHSLVSQYGIDKHFLLSWLEKVFQFLLDNVPEQDAMDKFPCLLELSLEGLNLTKAKIECDFVPEAFFTDPNFNLYQ